jgi:putative transposase
VVFEIDNSLLSVIRVLACLCALRGYPRRLRSGNAPELLTGKFNECAREDIIYWDFIEPGSPAKNGHIERFNRTYQVDAPDAFLLRNLDEVQCTSDEWRQRYSTERPNNALQELTLKEHLPTTNSPIAGSSA